MRTAFRANHLLVNLVLGVVLILGGWSYFSMPRSQYPEVRLNWVAVATVWPGASGEDVERYLTLPLESAIRQIPDVRYVAATSRDHVSALLIRFQELPRAVFETRLQELTRAIQAASGEFPSDARHPQLIELTTSSLFHTAMITVGGDVRDGSICRLAETVQRDLEAMEGVGRVWTYGLSKPELQVEFDPDAVAKHQALLDGLVDTLVKQTREYPAGGLDMDGKHYAVRVLGLGANPDFMAELPVPTADGGQVPLGSLAHISNGRSTPREMVTQDGKPAILLTVMKQEHANTLELIEHIKNYVSEKNRQLGQELLQVADDQTEATRHSVRAMELNAVLGLILVLGIAWFALGRRMALLVSIGVPFALAAMFLILHLSGQTLNVSVLLGVAIVLGIPLDDAVVVAEAISMRLNQGMDRLSALNAAMQEVSMPVTASVFATVAAFAPLMFLSGILGKFMFVVPLTVILTLFASLIASLWILPSHVASGVGAHVAWDAESRHRVRLSRKLRHLYGRFLAVAFRFPARVAVFFLALFMLSGLALWQGWLQVQWFTSDPLRVFNVNVTLPSTSGLADTLKTTQAVEARIRALARPGEIRAALSMAGMQFTPNEPLAAEHLGQVTVSLAPESGAVRGVNQFVDAVRAEVMATPGAKQVGFQVLSADLPQLSALHLRLSGPDQRLLSNAALALRGALEKIEGLHDFSDDAVRGKPRITLRLDSAAAARAGIDPYQLAGYIRLHFDGVAVAKVADGAVLLDVVVRGKAMDAHAIQAWLSKPLRLPSGQTVLPGDLFSLEFDEAAGQRRRINYQPSVAMQVELDSGHLSYNAATAQIKTAWEGLRSAYPGVSLEFGGELDDVRDSLESIVKLFLIGLAAMYLLLAVQFGSAWLPVLVLATAPMAFAGALLGLMLTGQPLTLYTLYGGIALGGVAVNASIMLAAASRDRQMAGFPPISAAFYAARRRLIPILITTLSIIAGLLALALGLAGQSVLWGPLAATLVWGLAFATPLTLFATPLLYGYLAGLFEKPVLASEA